jgi:hypothetical protein
MKKSRREFIVKTAAGAAVISAGLSTCIPKEKSSQTESFTQYQLVDQAAFRPVVKSELFADPIIIESLELLRYKDNFLCIIKTKDGAEGISVSNNMQMISLYPNFYQQASTLFYWQGCETIGKAFGRSICLQKQLQITESLPLGAVGDNRICHSGFIG